MPPAKMRVELLSHTPDALELIYAAFRQCYHAGYAGDMWPKLKDDEIPREKQTAFIMQILESGHVSPIEHVSFSFALSGVSRALTHQLVRHRLASYSQQSQRYVNASNFDYVLPPAIARNSKAVARYARFMEEVGAAYKDIRALLESDGRDGAKANEDARFVLPQATQTCIVVSMNCRSLLNFFEQRCCLRAQWEIRAAANLMLEKCRAALPEVFAGAGAKCTRLGFCPEGERFSCGRYPLAPNRDPSPDYP